MDTKKKLEQVPSSTNLKQIGVMEVKAKVEMDLGSYLLMFLGKRHRRRYGDSYTNVKENGEMSRWCKNFLSFLFFGDFFSFLYAILFSACFCAFNVCLISSFPFFMVILSFFFLICDSFIPLNWNGGLDTFFFVHIYIQSYLHTYGIGGF